MTRHGLWRRVIPHQRSTWEALLHGLQDWGRVSASGPWRQQAWSPEPSRTPVLRSGQEGQVMFDSQLGCSLVLVTAWFVRYTSGSPTLSPGELFGGVSAVRVELVMVKPPFLLSPGHTWCLVAAAPPGTPSTLTGGLSFPSLEALAFPEWKYFEGTKLSKISL